MSDEKKRRCSAPQRLDKIIHHSNGLGNNEKNLKIYGVSQLNKYLNRNKEFIFSLVEFFAVHKMTPNLNFPLFLFLFIIKIYFLIARR